MEREIKEKLLCLKSVDCGEADRMLYLLSTERGLFKAKIKGVKKPKAKLSFASFPFCFGEYLLVKMGQSYVVTNCNFIDNFASLVNDINKYYAGCGILDIASLITKENQECTNLFVSTIKCLNLLCYSKTNIYLVLCKYILDSLDYLGFKIISKTNGESEVFFDFNTGSLLNEPVEDAVKLNEADYNCLKYLLTADAGSLSEEKSASKNCLRLLSSYFELKTDEQLKVLQVFTK